jgi:hypothetical protein
MVNFNLHEVPFSRYGSYMAISRRSAKTERWDGLYLRTIRGGAVKDDVFRVFTTAGGAAKDSVFHIVPVDDQKQIPYTEQAAPTLLTLGCTGGKVRLCFADSKVLRIRGDGVGLRLEHAASCVAFPAADPRTFILIDFDLASQYAVTSIKGTMVTTAPWNGKANGRERVVLEFQPDADGVFECAVEEFGTEWQPHAYKMDFEQCQQQVQGEFQNWLNQQLPLPGDFADARELAAYVNWSCVVDAEGRFKRPAMLMSKNWMTNVWSWDHCFNAMALVTHAPEAAWDQFMVMADAQHPNGAFPDMYNDQRGWWSFFKPPIHGWALRWMMDRNDAIGIEKLAESYDSLTRWTNWWLLYRDDDGDGVPHYHHGNDSGWDNATVFMHGGGVPIESPDLIAFLTIQTEVLSEVAERLGKPDARHWRARSDALLQKLLSEFWRGDRFVARQAHSHQSIDADSLLLYIPIILGKRLPVEIQVKLVADLKQKGEFLTEHGLATERINSPDYEKDGYWRGPIWAPSTMIIVAGLLDIGEVEFAQEISQRFCHMAAHYGMAENFDPLTGMGLRDRAYSWTSSVFLMLGNIVVR